MVAGRNPFRVMRLAGLSPMVARLRGQPWAMRRNSFGVMGRPRQSGSLVIRIESFEVLLGGGIEKFDDLGGGIEFCLRGVPFEQRVVREGLVR